MVMYVKPQVYADANSPEGLRTGDSRNDAFKFASKESMVFLKETNLMYSSLLMLGFIRTFVTVNHTAKLKQNL